MQSTSIAVSKRQKAGPHLVRVLLLICAGYYTGDRSSLTSFSVTILYAQALPAEVHSTFCGHHRMKSGCVKCSQLSCCTCSMRGKHEYCQQQPRSCCSEHGVTTAFDPQPRCASKKLRSSPLLVAEYDCHDAWSLTTRWRVLQARPSNQRATTQFVNNCATDTYRRVGVLNDTCLSKIACERRCQYQKGSVQE